MCEIKNYCKEKGSFIPNILLKSDLSNYNEVLKMCNWRTSIFD